MAAVDDLPGIAPVAMQQGRFVAQVIAARAGGEPPPGAFRYRDKGTMATVGPRRAIVDAFGLRVGGFAGSLLWAFIHLYYLIGWGNRSVTLLGVAGADDDPQPQQPPGRRRARGRAGASA